jgi:hypothetical protein
MKTVPDPVSILFVPISPPGSPVSAVSPTLAAPFVPLLMFTVFPVILTSPSTLRL